MAPSRRSDRTAGRRNGTLPAGKADGHCAALERRGLKTLAAACGSMSAKQEKKMKKLFHQILKFGIVGIIAFLIDYGLLYVFTEWCGIYYLVSSTLSFSISVIFNYIASVIWVFDVNKKHSKVRNFILFVIFSVIGLGINQLIMWAGVEMLALHYMLVKIGATAIVMVWNFITRKKFLEQ